MLFSIGHAITLVIVLLMFLVYHRLTANNRSLEKVKKLADRLSGELDAYVGSRSEELKHFGIDLEVQQKAAKIALEKLQAAQETVAEKADAIGAVAERFREYDTVLARLMEMTARVDQNLAKIHEDEAFAESVLKRLDSARKSLAAVERDIPRLKDEFASDAAAAVTSFKQSILQELGGSLTDAKAQISAAREESLQTLEAAKAARDEVDAAALSARESVETTAREALEEAARRAGDVEDEAFAALNASLNSRLGESKESTEALLAQLGKATSEQVGSLRRAVEEFRSSWRTEADGMIADLASKSQDIQDRYDQSLSEAKEAQASITAGLEESLGRFQASASATALSIRSAQDGFEKAHASLLAKLEATKDSIEEDFAAFGQAFEDRRTKFEAGFAEETDALRSSLSKLGEEIAELQASAYGKAEERLSEMEESLLGDLRDKRAQAFKRIDQWLSEMERTLSNIGAEAAQRRSAEESARTEEFKAHLAQVRKDLYAQMDKLADSIAHMRDELAVKSAEAPPRQADDKEQA